MRMLEANWSRALSLVCEVALRSLENLIISVIIIRHSCLKNVLKLLEQVEDKFPMNRAKSWSKYQVQEN
jgi:Mor family transcriptional regulator